MSRLLKIVLYVLASVILLIVIAAVALPLFINPNDFKPEIQTAVKENTGRDLLIEGDLDLSVFPWIGISTGKLSLSNAQGFPEQPFAEIEESNVKVKLLPLLSKKLEVSRIVLKGLTLNLAKNKQGISNWDDLAGAKTDPEIEPAKTSTTDTEKAPSASPLAALAIGGVSIEQAKIIWDDQQQGKHIEINDFNFSTGKLVFDQAIDVDLSLKISNSEPELTETLSFSTDLIINEQLDNFKLTAINIESITRGKDIPGESLTVTLLAEIALNLAQQTIDITDLKLNTNNLTLLANINGTNIKDKPVFKGSINIEEFNLAQLMKSMAIPLPKMQDPKALNRLSVALNLLATPDSADIKNLAIKLDDTNISGSSKINNFAKPAINFNLKIDAIDADRYLAPAAKGKSSKPVATPASAAAAGAALFPVETLRGLNVNGLLAIDSLKINNLNMQGLSLKLNAKNGLIKTQQSVKQLYKGDYTGYTTINVKNRTPTLALNEKLSNVHVEPLLKDMLGEARMSGVVNANAKIQSRGNTTAAIKSALNGNINFNFKDGVIRGFNLQKIIDNSKSLIDGTPLPTENKNDQTVFSVIRGTAKIKNGLVSNDDLYAEASKLRVNGKGTANLVSEKLDYTVNAKLLKTVATATTPEKIKGLPIIVNVGNTIAKPTYKLDIAAMLMEKNKEKIYKKRDELIKKLDEKIGPGVGNLLKGLF
ncbi:MAG: AsmA family protein [Methylomarinum sp.]|nr:AsmA family protein [Methylomarinum sp.]